MRYDIYHRKKASPGQQQEEADEEEDGEATAEGPPPSKRLQWLPGNWRYLKSVTEKMKKAVYFEERGRQRFCYVKSEQ